MMIGSVRPNGKKTERELKYTARIGMPGMTGRWMQLTWLGMHVRGCTRIPLRKRGLPDKGV